jgi:hypothetical protein
MTNSILNTKTAIATAIIAFGAFGISTLSAHAGSTASLAQCKAFTKEKVVKCCDTVIKQQGAPLWFREANMSCSSAVSCSGGGGGYQKSSYSVAMVSKYRCWIPMYESYNQGRNRGGENEQRGEQGGKD